MAKEKARNNAQSEIAKAMQVVDHEKRGLYDPRFEHDNCGIGAIVNIKGNKTHDTVSGALDIVEKLEHRAGKDAEGKTGDGVGILLQISHNSVSYTHLTAQGHLVFFFINSLGILLKQIITSCPR